MTWLFYFNFLEKLLHWFLQYLNHGIYLTLCAQVAYFSTASPFVMPGFVLDSSHPNVEKELSHCSLISIIKIESVIVHMLTSHLYIFFGEISI
jgi:hypothetical protein